MGVKGADARRLFARISPLHLPRASQAFPTPSFFFATWRGRSIVAGDAFADFFRGVLYLSLFFCQALR